MKVAAKRPLTAPDVFLHHWLHSAGWWVEKLFGFLLGVEVIVCALVSSKAAGSLLNLLDIQLFSSHFTLLKLTSLIQLASTITSY